MNWTWAKAASMPNSIRRMNTLFVAVSLVSATLFADEARSDQHYRGNYCNLLGNFALRVSRTYQVIGYGSQLELSQADWLALIETDALRPEISPLRNSELRWVVEDVYSQPLFETAQLRGQEVADAYRRALDWCLNN